MSRSEPASLLPCIDIFRVRPTFTRIEIRTLNRQNETATIRPGPSEFNLAIAIPAIYKKLIAFPFGLGFIDFIFFRFRIRVVLLELTEVASLNFVVGIFFNLFLELILPMVVILERSSFPPAFAFSPGLDGPNVSNDQFMTTAFVAGELLSIIIVHSLSLSLNQNRPIFPNKTKFATTTQPRPSSLAQ